MFTKLLFVLCLFVNALPGLTCESTIESQDTLHKVTIACTPHADEHVIHDAFAFTLDTPHYTVLEWKTSATPSLKYVPLLKDTRPVHTGPFEITLLIKQTSPSKEPAHVHMQYLSTANKKPAEFVVGLPVTPADKEVSSTPNTPSKHTSHTSLKTLLLEKIKTYITVVFATIADVSRTLTQHIKGTHSRVIQILLIFLLGVLMSLTPCIYPMIPVTVGILQANSAQSFVRNFIIALSYTLGVASTFAGLGLLAATGSVQFGSLAGSPFFILLIVFILGYLGLSMFGWYDMYIPRFLQPKQTNVRRGSPVSAFMFGAISGTIASPCLSPGLAFVLSIVASLQNTLLGLLLLFAFGVGSSMPLLIIGTFSSSLNVLPKAGNWMVEVKKLFGFMLFGMCFYYLHVIVPTPVLLGIMSAFLAVKGVWYFMQIKVHDSARIRRYKNGMGFVLIASGVVLVFYASKEWACAPTTQCATWSTDFAAAQARARAEHKNLLVDVTADWCSVCKMLEKKVLQSHEVSAVSSVVPVTVNSTQQSSEPYATLKKEYGILGVPTILLIDGQTGELIKRWGSELLEQDITTFVAELKA